VNLVSAHRLRGVLVMGLWGLSWLSGCSSDPQAHAHSGEVVQLRNDAGDRLDAALKPFDAIGSAIGRAGDDVCDPGQHNPQVNTVYQFKCDRTQRVLVEPTATDLAQAYERVRVAFGQAGCRVVTYDASDKDLAEQSAMRSGGLVLVGTDCGGVDLRVNWITSWTGQVDDYESWDPRNSSRPAMPNGFTVESSSFSPAQLGRIGDIKPVAWWVEAHVEYAYEPR
jgi:hypothetical protein